MKSRALRPIALIALAAAAGQVRAWDLQGSLGGSYWRLDTQRYGIQASTPMWDFGGHLTLSGSPVNPRALLLSGTVDYKQIRNQYFLENTTSSYLYYQAAATFFPGGRFSLTLNGSRALADFTSANPSASPGAVVTDTASASLGYAPEGLPRLRLDLGYTQLENRFAGARTTGDITRLLLGASQGVGPHNYQITYDTSWNQGSLAESNYRTHRVILEDTSRLSRDLELRLREWYYLRLPTAASPLSPRVDDNSFGVGASWLPADRPFRSHFDYGYHSQVVEAPGTPRTQLVSQALGNATEWALHPELTLLGSLRAGYTLERLAGAESDAWNTTAGAGLRWTRTAGMWSYLLSGSASGGAQQAPGGGVDPALGLSLSGSISTTRPRWQGNAYYTFAYSRNAAAVSGWNISQQLNAGLDYRLTDALLGQAGLSASSNRVDSSFLGTSGARTGQIFAGIAWWSRYSLRLHLAFTDGLNGAVFNAGAADGFFLPLRYNTHSWVLGATATANPFQSLTLSATARFLQTTSPGRDTQSEQALSASVGYALGAFTFYLQDDYTHAAAGGSTQNGNLFMVRVARGFGARF